MRIENGEMIKLVDLVQIIDKTFEQYQDNGAEFKIEDNNIIIEFDSYDFEVKE